MYVIRMYVIFILGSVWYLYIRYSDIYIERFGKSLIGPTRFYKIFNNYYIFYYTILYIVNCYSKVLFLLYFFYEFRLLRACSA